MQCPKAIRMWGAVASTAVLFVTDVHSATRHNSIALSDYKKNTDN